MVTRLVLAALALSLAAPAAAQSFTVAVPYGDLDLTKDAGRDTLDRRLDRAARRVCGGYPERNLDSLASFNRCMAAARTSYQPQLELALNTANARRVAVLADKLAVFVGF